MWLWSINTTLLFLAKSRVHLVNWCKRHHVPSTSRENNEMLASLADQMSPVFVSSSKETTQRIKQKNNVQAEAKIHQMCLFRSFLRKTNPPFKQRKVLPETNMNLMSSWGRSTPMGVFFPPKNGAEWFRFDFPCSLGSFFRFHVYFIFRGV